MKRKPVQDVIVFFAVLFDVLMIVSLLLAVHFLLLSNFPSLADHTLVIAAISLFSTIFGAAISISGANVKRGHKGIVLGFFVVAVYALFAGVGLSSSFPRWYSLLFVSVGIIGTSFTIGDFTALSMLFGKIGDWQRLESTLSQDYLKDQVREFDIRLRSGSASVLLFTTAFVILCIVALASGPQAVEPQAPAQQAAVSQTTALQTPSPFASVPFLLFSGLFIWFAAVLYLFTRLLRRTKALFLEGHEIDEANIIRPFFYGVIISFVVLALVALIAADSSPLHYSKIVGLVSGFFERSAETSTGGGQSAADGREMPPELSEQSPAPVPGGAVPMIDLSVVSLVVRYVLIGLGILGIIFYVSFSLWRHNKGVAGAAGSARSQSFRRFTRSFRMFFLRMYRIWRLLGLNFIGLLKARAGKRSSNISEIITLRHARTDSIAKRIEMNIILRFYRRLIEWAERNGVHYDSSITAGELITKLIPFKPERTKTFGMIEATFETAFYSDKRLGRDRIREYVRNVKDVTGRS